MLESKHAIEHLAQLKPNSIFRTFIDSLPTIKKIHSILNHPYLATTRLQTDGINLSDAVCIWLTCREVLNKVQQTIDHADLNLCANIIANLNARFTTLFTPTAKAAVFLDPRLCDVLSAEDKRTAICTLGQIWEYICQFSGRQQRENDNAADDNENTVSEIGVLDEFIAASSGTIPAMRSDSIWGGKVATLNYQKQQSEILFELREYDRKKEKAPANPREVNYLLTFWKQKASTCPELYDIAKFIALIPPTQVAVERTFSVVKYVLDDRRMRLFPKMLNAIVCIRLHKVLANDIMQFELNALNC